MCVVVGLRSVCHPLIFDVSDVPVFVSVIGDNLDAAVGQSNPVFS